MFKVFSRFQDSGNDRQPVNVPARGDGSYADTPIIIETSPLAIQNYTSGRYINEATVDVPFSQSRETLAPPPTGPEDNRKLTIKHLTYVMSLMYATLLVTIGIIINTRFIDATFSLIFPISLCLIGFLYIVFLIFDINRYKSIALKNQRNRILHQEKISEYFRTQGEESSPIDELTPMNQAPEVSFYGNQESLPGIPLPDLTPLKHKYCFSHGRHSDSFYLKLGAAGFASGHLVHSVLLIAVQVGYKFDRDVKNSECFDVLEIILDVISPCYCFIQLYFIFKYSNVIILHAQGLARFAFMHLISTSFCLWMSAIARETILSLVIYANSKYGSQDNSTTVNSTQTIIDSSYDTVSKKSILNISSFYDENCSGSKVISTFVENFSPYLYPFTVEFNILIVGIYYIIWSNIGNCKTKNDNANDNSFYDHAFCQLPTANEDNDFTSNMVIHADCHASYQGLFAGIFLITVVVGMLIIGFVFSSFGEGLLELGYMLNNCLKLGLHFVMLVAAIFVFYQLRKLDINLHTSSVLDLVLLFICLPAFFLETILSMIATINILNVVKSIDLMIMVTQVIIQTPVIVDGLRRCSNSKQLRRSKPGRELLMFLLIANVSMWLLNTFSYKSPDSVDERYEYYGKALWTAIGHFTLPLIMFYRFHSSACFADIWHSAYKPAEEH